MALVSILGGTGVFGSRITRNLARSTDASLRIVGRNEELGRAIASEVNGEFLAVRLDNTSAVKRAIADSSIVIHAAGPFQCHDYHIAQRCIEAGAHYLDLADARHFVAGIGRLDDAAKRRGVFVCSGASSVPAVTHAMVSEAAHDMQRIESITIALSPGNQNPRGASTIGAILSYLGRPIRVWDSGRWTHRPGWGDAHMRQFPPPLGARRVHNCDVPDLELFPAEFDVRSVRFYAGVELNVINYTLSTVAAIRRVFPLGRIERLAPLFLRGSLLLYRFGSKNGSLAAWVDGVNANDERITRRIAIVTEDDGPATPSAPVTILTQNILRSGPPMIGAMPCMGLLTLVEVESHLKQFGVYVMRGDQHGWA